MTTFRDYVATLTVAYTDKNGKDWYDMDISELPTIASAAYEDYRASQDLANAKRKRFEEITRVAVDDKAIQFGHKFQKLSFTLVDKAVKASSGKAKVSLNAWLDANQHNGRA